MVPDSFEKNSYWLNELYSETMHTNHQVVSDKTFTLKQVSKNQFIAEFDLEHPLILDHLINKQPVVPGVWLVELINSIVEKKLGDWTQHYKHITWQNKIATNSLETDKLDTNKVSVEVNVHQKGDDLFITAVGASSEKSIFTCQVPIGESTDIAKFAAKEDLNSLKNSVSVHQCTKKSVL